MQDQILSEIKHCSILKNGFGKITPSALQTIPLQK